MTAGTAGDAATMHHTYNVPIARNRTEKMPSSLAHRWRLNTRPTDDDDMQMVSQFHRSVHRAGFTMPRQQPHCFRLSPDRTKTA